MQGKFFENGKADKRRIRKAEHRNTPDVKKRRKVLHGEKEKREDNTKEKGGTTYMAGAL